MITKEMSSRGVEIKNALARREVEHNVRNNLIAIEKNLPELIGDLKEVAPLLTEVFQTSQQRLRHERDTALKELEL
jgi:hypothetical protein